MRYGMRDLQARLAALGYHPGPIDGIRGRRTDAAVAQAMRDHRAASESALFHRSGIHRIHLHWDAGSGQVSDITRRSYNGCIDADGHRHAGRWGPEDQAAYRAGERGASHTLSANTGAIGIALCGMAGAVESPFNPGGHPISWDQIDALAGWVAEFCAAYWIPVSRYSVLTHAEIQPTLGIRQRFKWDITWLPDMARPGDPIEVGDRIRRLIADRMPEIAVAA